MQKKPIVLWLCGFGLVVLSLSCRLSSHSDCISLEPAIYSNFPFTIVDEELSSIKARIFDTPDIEIAWKQITDFSQHQREEGWGSWDTILSIQPNIENPHAGGVFHVNPIKIASQQETEGYMLIQNGNASPYPLRIIFLLDYKQVPINRSGITSFYYDLPMLDPNEERGLAFSIPKLPTGFHQLSVLLVTDAVNLSQDWSYRPSQRAKFTETRYDLWVGIDSLPETVPVFLNEEEGSNAQKYEADIDFLSSPDEPGNNPLYSLSSPTGKRACVALRFYNSKTGWQPDSTKPPVPLRLIVFLNDQAIGYVDYQFTADTPENYKLKLSVPMPKKSGIYQLSGVVFWYPDYSQFDDEWKRIGYFETASFTRRILVEIQP